MKVSDPRERKSEWETRYRKGDTGWDRGTVSPALGHWLEEGGLAPCRILVPGCGRGYEVIELARRGFQVVAVDIAAAPFDTLHAELEKEKLTAEVRQADLLDWNPPAPFEAIYEQTAICALPPEDWSDYSARLAAWLSPGGRLYALFMQTGRPGGPPYHCNMDIMRMHFPAADWRWAQGEPLNIPHPSGFYELGYVLERL